MKVKFIDWVLNCDLDATRQAYLAVEDGAERCSCGGCRNWVLFREKAYPGEVLGLFQELGIDYRKEAEVYSHPEPGGLRGYGGWFHFVGSIISGTDAYRRAGDKEHGRIELEPIAENFSLGFTSKVALVPKFFGKEVVQLSFSTKLPWILPEKDPDEEWVQEVTRRHRHRFGRWRPLKGS